MTTYKGRLKNLCGQTCFQTAFLFKFSYYNCGLKILESQSALHCFFTPQTMEHQTQKLRAHGHFRPHCFRGRWLQRPIYLGRIAAQAIYTYKFLRMLWHWSAIWALWMKHHHVRRTQSDWRRDDCQSADDGDYLKVKPSMSIISILSIHLLQTFINAANLSEKQKSCSNISSTCFLISAITIALTDKIVYRYSTTHKAH